MCAYDSACCSNSNGVEVLVGLIIANESRGVSVARRPYGVRLAAITAMIHTSHIENVRSLLFLRENLHKCSSQRFPTFEN